MNSENFCYWLQGLFEIGDIKELDERQVQIIKDHLNLVLVKVTPNWQYLSTSQNGVSAPGLC